MNKSTNSMSNFSKPSDASTALENFDSFLLSLFAGAESTLLIEVESSESNGAPDLTVTLNNHTLFCQEIAAGIHTYSMPLPCNPNNTLSLAMTNKLPSDTIVDNNVIVQDKWLKIHRLEIDGYNLITDYDFFNKFFKYYTNDAESSPMSGFWHNSRLELTFDSPFVLWYTALSKRSMADELATRVVESNTIASLEEKIKRSLETLKF